MNLPNPTQGMSTEFQLLGDLIEQTKQQCISRSSIKDRPVFSETWRCRLKRSEKTSKKPLEKYKLDDKTGLSGVNAKLTQGGPISKALMVQI